MTQVNDVTMEMVVIEGEKVRPVDMAVHTVSVCRSTKRTTTGTVRTYLWQCKTAKAALKIQNRLLDAGYEAECTKIEDDNFQNVSGVALYTTQAASVVQTRELLRRLVAETAPSVD